MPTNCMICAVSVQLLAGVCLHSLCLCLCASIYICPVVPLFSVIRSALAPQSDASCSFHSCAHSVSCTAEAHLMSHRTDRSENQSYFLNQTHAFIGLTSLCIAIRILYEIQVFQVVIPCNLVGLRKGWKEYGASIFMVAVTWVLRRFLRYTNCFITCHDNLLFAIVYKYFAETSMFLGAIQRFCLLQKVTVKSVAI